MSRGISHDLLTFKRQHRGQGVRYKETDIALLGSLTAMARTSEPTRYKQTNPTAVHVTIMQENDNKTAISQERRLNFVQKYFFKTNTLFRRTGKVITQGNNTYPIFVHIDFITVCRRSLCIHVRYPSSSSTSSGSMVPGSLFPRFGRVLLRYPRSRGPLFPPDRGSGFRPQKYFFRDLLVVFVLDILLCNCLLTSAITEI